MKDLFEHNTHPHFSKELPADLVMDNRSRQVYKACFSFVNPLKPSNPSLVHSSKNFADELGVSLNNKAKLVQVMSGATSFNGFESYAMCYGGHQFGNWAGQLGDGRAINIAEVDLKDGINWKFQLKGAGPTPYSRNSDGLAVLRSSVREYLCSEAMHHLGVPTTRALSLVKTGDLVLRDIMYDGNPENEQGAIVCRVSPSFIRFGSFEIFASRQDKENLQKLVDYTIKHHYPQLGENRDKATYLKFFEAVANRTLEMILHWQRVGFVHGVMNTDNMSILGLTIDYGPYGWLEDYSPLWTPNTTDAQNRRYRYGNQPDIALWNLVQLANALYPLIEEVKGFQTILEKFRTDFQARYHQMMCGKLGLFNDQNVPKEYIQKLETLLEQWEIDMTIFFREFSKNITDFDVFWKGLSKSSYLDKEKLETGKKDWAAWFDSFSKYLAQENTSREERVAKMKSINPKYVLRNYMVQLAINDAEKNDYNLLDELYQLLSKPYDEQPEMEKWYAKRPEWARHKVGCSMLSCSS
ncbi:YdiU family protein [Echinicola soli]|uniref:Protein nucleotidyltransferase YdiU n=1 Tax=Echinicola soli TaxID=2591634 RepID=A0A514CFX9_9BACT|nr:YdiU family protein [Echinicola soli]QDH78574.1 YdiU family protein [Echinicola soli]